MNKGSGDSERRAKRLTFPAFEGRYMRANLELNLAKTNATTPHKNKTDSARNAHSHTMTRTTINGEFPSSSVLLGALLQ
ncbi:hypothetical protein TRAPUB_9197 [Trametes pubescens]|uniref:Uncharacterized protein n=1 Tax=Trametes pubescens TaxID=154538 RepID=A0A1M2W317_TRAPU|nr:hypothetical protein TRAPUB_9197 [Trametes pubescens]